MMVQKSYFMGRSFADLFSLPRTKLEQMFFCLGLVSLGFLTSLALFEFTGVRLPALTVLVVLLLSVVVDPVFLFFSILILFVLETSFFHPYYTEAGKLSFLVEISLTFIVVLCSGIAGSLLRRSRLAHLSDVEIVADLNRKLVLRSKQLAQSESQLRNLIVVLEKNSQQKSAELDAVMQNSPLASFIKDTAGVLTMVNPEFEKLCLKSKNDLIGKKCFEVWPADVSEMVRKCDQEISVTRRPAKLHFTLPIKGELCSFYSVRFPIYDGGGKLQSICGIITDMTEVQKLSDSKREAEIRERSVHEISKQKTQFLAHMSHEIRTPVSGIIGMTKLLADSSLSFKQRSYLTSVEKLANSLMGIVNDILDLSKVDAGKLVLEKIPFCFEELIRETRLSFLPQIREKNLSFKTKVHFPLDQHFMGDVGRIRQILNNIINNAIKFTDEGAVELDIVFAGSRGGAQLVQITVTDTGIGMTAEIKEKIFNKFSQGDSSPARRYGGTGLGLAISKKLAELMGGEITLADDVVQGTKIICTVPLKLINSSLSVPFAGSYRISSPLLSKVARQKFRILVAEDNAINQEVTVRMLTKAGYKAHGVNSGIEVLESMKHIYFDLILMDCQMPEMDGYEATAEIRRLGVRLPIVALTANAFDEDRANCLKVGMSDYLTKPVKESMLVETLDRWLTIGDGIHSSASEMRERELMVQ